MATDPGSQFINANRAGDLARDYQTIYSEINLIQAAILEIAGSGRRGGGGKFSATVTDNTPMTFVSRVTAVEVLESGIDYFPIAATATFFHPRPVDDGVGNDATGWVIISNGAVNSFAMTSPGENYEDVTVRADLSGTGDGLATLALRVDAGVIVTATVVGQGSLYLVGESIPIVHPGGSGADLTISAVGAGGSLLGVKINDGGSGYSAVTASVVINHPSGLGFSGLVQVDTQGLVMGVSVLNGGSGYVDLLPEISITDPNLIGSGAIMRAITDVLLGELLSVEIINGGAHYPDDTIGTVITAPTSSGTGASVAVIIAENTFGTNPEDYYLEITNQADDMVIRDQLTYVIGYFTNLGYSIDAVVNPATLSSIQWILYW